MNTLTCALVGHDLSPRSFGSDEESMACRRLKAALRSEIQAMIDFDCSMFISALRSETEVWAAEIVAEQMARDPRLSFIRILSQGWNEQCPAAYTGRVNRIAQQCEPLNVPESEAELQLVFLSDFILAVYDGKAEGRIACTVNYAEENHCPVIRIDPTSATVKPLKEWSLPFAL